MNVNGLNDWHGNEEGTVQASIVYPIFYTHIFESRLLII